MLILRCRFTDRLRWLEPDEEARLLAAAAKSKNRELPAIVTMALETGLRRGELLGLTWDRVDLSRGVIRLEVTKSGRRREVPMRQAVYNVLTGPPEPREGRVFKTRSIRTAFENAVTEAKLDDFHFHDCRHHFASWFVMRGGSLQALKEVLGHASLTMTVRYAHLAPEHLRSEVAKTERRANHAAVSTQSAQSVCAEEPVEGVAAVTSFCRENRERSLNSSLSQVGGHPIAVPDPRQSRENRGIGSIRARKTSRCTSAASFSCHGSGKY